jgi:hypothetical protein
MRILGSEVCEVSRSNDISNLEVTREGREYAV